ncbi:MAG TPA: DUF2934 domain-containing protein [Candidatus Binatia bacterium]|nr:DUF2934 domain-containing protein [Candidatus Binatia bacterium]
MPKAPRDKGSTTPRKRSRKAAPESGNGVHAGNGKGAVAESVTPSAAVANQVQLSPGLEERIRLRAYELYQERGGSGGSPEQDWLRAQAEICGTSA